MVIDAFHEKKDAGQPQLEACQSDTIPYGLFMTSPMAFRDFYLTLVGQRFRARKSSTTTPTACTSRI